MGGGCFLGRRWDEGWDSVSGEVGGVGIQDIKGWEQELSFIRDRKGGQWGAEDV